MLAAFRRFAQFSFVLAAAAPLAAQAAPSRFAFSASEYAVGEAAATVTLTVERRGSLVDAVSVDYASADLGAKFGADYRRVAGRLNWAAGDGAPKTITVRLIDDDKVEDVEGFRVLLAAPVGGTLQSPASARVLIGNDDSLIDFERAAARVDETAGTVTLQLQRRGDNGQAATGTFVTRDVGATSGVDYGPAGGSVSWAAGETGSKTITIPILDDTLLERDEFFFVDLTALGAAVLGRNASARVQIINDDLPELSLDDADLDEGTNAETSALFTVRLSAATPAPVEVHYHTADGTATAGDYHAAAGTLLFAPGELQKTVAIRVAGDTVNENNERFKLIACRRRATRASRALRGRWHLVRDDDNRPAQDLALVQPALDALVRGCDLLDARPLPVPVPDRSLHRRGAAAGSIQSAERGGTGKRVNFSRWRRCRATSPASRSTRPSGTATTASRPAR